MEIAMADRSVHYEAAFEAFLRGRGIPYVAVDEAKRALFSNAKLKSFDFVVYSKAGRNLLLDVKGRQACSSATVTTGAGSAGRSSRVASGSRASLQNWVQEQDVVDLEQWQQVFGEGFTAVLAFVYWIDPPLTPEPGMFDFKDRWYWALGVEVDEYRNHMRRRSPKWGTVCLPAADFRELARPIESWL